MCKHWIELDGNNGLSVECCKAKDRTTNCCGTRDQCWCPDYYADEEEEKELERFRHL